ncbi:hypothetical protein [Vannielia litorea]|uniref:Uncharacterized protein n=1 Tax=Vannielia litorea TaxID=1217970 RepID=A0A1N6FYU4_9RHOB|nr:hypothetical protein [Vannielia litorea]SIO00382.1 hypothetical protein SAMN05444002_2067 [Vannielia litorea]
MSDVEQRQERREFRAEFHSLWRITFCPAIWALHFTLSYCATAIVCAKGGSVEMLRLGIGFGTLVALAAIAWLGWRSWRQWDLLNDREWENDAGSSEDRHQFLGHAAFLLSIISFIGVAYVALPALLIGSCR